MNISLNEQIKKEYPIQDSTWPSRRWNQDMTDYCDLSGHEGYLDVNCNNERLCKQCGCPNNSNEFSDYCNDCYDEKYPDFMDGLL